MFMSGPVVMALCQAALAAGDITVLPFTRVDQLHLDSMPSSTGSVAMRLLSSLIA